MILSINCQTDVFFIKYLCIMIPCQKTLDGLEMTHSLSLVIFFRFTWIVITRTIIFWKADEFGSLHRKLINYLCKSDKRLYRCQSFFDFRENIYSYYFRGGEFISGIYFVIKCILAMFDRRMTMRHQVCITNEDHINSQNRWHIWLLGPPN